MKAAELPGLNLLRVLAAIYMVMFHLHASFRPGIIQTFFSRGTSDTGLFFLLSGFLLTHLYTGRPMDDQGQRRFVWRRAARIFPANLLALLFLLGTQALQGRPLHDWNSLAESLLLIQSWVIGDSHVLNAPAWSMSCLLFFYLLFPVVLPRLERLNTTVMAGLLVALWLLGASLPLALAFWPSAYGMGDWTLYLHNSPLFRAPEFVLGMGVALLTARYRARPRAREWHILAWRWTCRIAAVAVLGVMALAPSETVAVNNGLFAPLSLVLLLAFLSPGPLLTRLGRSKPMRATASASICIFLLHMTWQRLFAEGVFPHLSLSWTPLTTAAYLALVLSSSLALDAWICQPLARLLTGRTGKAVHLPRASEDLPVPTRSAA